ncbi:MAG: hypothetical protein QOD09_580 [Bradyrhizobium sp.]|nr:hypothetical protein [Bradyrhizobium sp.]
MNKLVSLGAAAIAALPLPELRRRLRRRTSSTADGILVPICSRAALRLWRSARTCRPDAAAIASVIIFWVAPPAPTLTRVVEVGRRLIHSQGALVGGFCYPPLAVAPLASRGIDFAA